MTHLPEDIFFEEARAPILGLATPFDLLLLCLRIPVLDPFPPAPPAEAFFFSNEPLLALFGEKALSPFLSLLPHTKQ